MLLGRIGAETQGNATLEKKKKKKKKIQTRFSEWPLRDYQSLTSLFSSRTLNSFKLYVQKIKKEGQFCQKAFLIISNKK